MVKLCSMDGCDNKIVGRGWCRKHYTKLFYWDKHLAQQRKKRAEIGNRYTHKYEKTPKGFLMRLYRNMQSRVTGVQTAKFHLYEGRELLPRQEFYEWALQHPTFLQLFKEWEESGYQQRLTPSPDRINSKLGYTLDNMEWVTHSENSRRSH